MLEVQVREICRTLKGNYIVFEVITRISLFQLITPAPCKCPSSPDRLTLLLHFTLSWLASLADDLWLGGCYLVIADLHRLAGNLSAFIVVTNSDAALSAETL
jgi:hypothetical protein